MNATDMKVFDYSFIRNKLNETCFSLITISTRHSFSTIVI